MEVKLIVVGGKGAGREVPVSGPEFLIGRHSDCQLRPQSDLVAPRHCAILLKEGYVGVRDFQTKTGTFVNGQRVEGEQELKTGNHLKVGPLEFMVELAVSVGGKKKPKVGSILEAAARTVQSADRSQQESDIDDLLGEEEPPPPIAPPRPAPTNTPEQTAAKPAEKEPNKPTEVPGRFGDVAKPSAASSQDAAREGLRNLLGGK